MVDGLTVIEVTVGLTKKPVHPTAVVTAAMAAASAHFRLELRIITNP
jgi:hypothetical protein